MEEKQITSLSCDVDPSNVRIFDIESFGDENKQDLTKMNPNPLLAQEIIIRDIIRIEYIARIVIF